METSPPPQPRWQKQAVHRRRHRATGDRRSWPSLDMQAGRRAPSVTVAASASAAASSMSSRSRVARATSVPSPIPGNR